MTLSPNNDKMNAMQILIITSTHNCRKPCGQIRLERHKKKKNNRYDDDDYNTIITMCCCLISELLRFMFFLKIKFNEVNKSLIETKVGASFLLQRFHYMHMVRIILLRL